MSERRIIEQNDDLSTRLDVFLAESLDCSRSRAASLIKAGQVKAERGAVKASRLCHFGDRFEVELPEISEGRVIPQDVPFELLYSDEAIAVVNKPAGVATHPGAGRPDGTLVNGLMARFPQLALFGATSRPGIVHRLDIGTSGLIVVGLTIESAKKISRSVC